MLSQHTVIHYANFIHKQLVCLFELLNINGMKTREMLMQGGAAVNFLC